MLLQGFLSLLLVQDVPIWQLVDLLGVSIDLVVVLGARLLVQVRGVCMDIVVLLTHQLLVTQILGVRVFDIEVTYPNLVLDIVQSLVQVLWLQVIS